MPAVRKTRNKLYRRLNHRQVFTCVCLRTFFRSIISMGLKYFWILRKDFFFFKSLAMQYVNDSSRQNESCPMLLLHYILLHQLELR